MRPLSEEDLQTAAKQLEESFTEYDRLLTENHNPELNKKITGESVSAMVNAAILNHPVLKRSYCSEHPELHKQYDQIRKLIARITTDGLETENPPERVEKTDDAVDAKVEATAFTYNTDTCKKHMANVLFYNSLIVITRALFDDRGIIKEFFKRFLNKLADLTSTEITGGEFVWPGSDDNQLLYQAVVNALLMKFVDPLFTKLHMLELKRVAEKEVEHSSSSRGMVIAKHIVALREQLVPMRELGTLTPADQIVFTQNYVTLQIKLKEFVSSRELRSELAAEDLQLISNAITNKIDTIWQRVRTVLENSGVIGVVSRDSKLNSLSDTINDLYHATLPFEKQPKAAAPKKTGFFRSLSSGKGSVKPRPSSTSPLLCLPKLSSARPASAIIFKSQTDSSSMTETSSAASSAAGSPQRVSSPSSTSTA